jgi:hypothetical protein
MLRPKPFSHAAFDCQLEQLGKHTVAFDQVWPRVFLANGAIHMFNWNDYGKGLLIISVRAEASSIRTKPYALWLGVKKRTPNSAQQGCRVSYRR